MEVKEDFDVVMELVYIFSPEHAFQCIDLESEQSTSDRKGMRQD